MMWRRVVAGAGALFHRRRWERDLDEEVRACLDYLVVEKTAQGLDPDDARRAARLEMGSIEAVKESVRDVGWENIVAAFGRDLAFAARLLRAHAGFTFACVLTLALGIGAAVVAFSIVDAVLVRPLPYGDADRLVTLSEYSWTGACPVSYPNFLDWQRENKCFSDLALSTRDSFSLVYQGRADSVQGRWVTSRFFSTLGVRPFIGRVSPGRNSPSDAVVVISHALWQRRFAGDPRAIGARIVLNDRPYILAGVLPRDFWFYEACDVFAPLDVANSAALTTREIRSGLRGIGRLRPGVTLAGARADMKRLSARLAAAYPAANTGHSALLNPLYQDAIGYAAPTLYVLLGAVTLVFLIACTNTSALVLAHAFSRDREFAIRAALGASPGRLARQIVAESALLAVLGCALGMIAARLLLAVMPHVLPRLEQLRMDRWVLASAVLSAVAATVLVSLAPGMSAAATERTGALRRRHDDGGVRRTRMHRLLVAAEVSLAVVLLTGAGLLVRTMRLLEQSDPGFDTRHTAVLGISLSDVRYRAAADVRRYYDAVLGRLSQVNGLQAAAVSTGTPMGSDRQEVQFLVEGGDARSRPGARLHFSQPGYLRSMGIRLLRGRFFTSDDTADSRLVVAIDDVLAQWVFPGGDAIGQRIVIPTTGLRVAREIVGIVDHVRPVAAGEGDWSEGNDMYVPLAQMPDAIVLIARPRLELVVRAENDIGDLLPAVMRSVRQVDPEQPFSHVRTINDLTAGRIADHRIAMVLLGILAAVAFTLAAVGLFGVVSYTTRRRRYEVGLRLAIGACRRDVVRLLVAQGLGPVLAGTAAGVGIAAALTRLIRGLLFGVSGFGAVTFGVAAALVVGVAMLAYWARASRVAHVDPTTTLRLE